MTPADLTAVLDHATQAGWITDAQRAHIARYYDGRTALGPYLVHYRYLSEEQVGQLSTDTGIGLGALEPAPSTTRSATLANAARAEEGPNPLHGCWVTVVRPILFWVYAIPKGGLGLGALVLLITGHAPDGQEPHPPELLLAIMSATLLGIVFWRWLLYDVLEPSPPKPAVQPSSVPSPPDASARAPEDPLLSVVLWSIVAVLAIVCGVLLVRTP